MQVEHDRAATQADTERREHQRVRHVVYDDGVMPLAKIFSDEAKERTQHEVQVLEDVIQFRANPRTSHVATNDLDTVDVFPRRFRALVQANDLDAPAGIAQRMCFALNPRVANVIGMQQHAANRAPGIVCRCLATHGAVVRVSSGIEPRNTVADPLHTGLGQFREQGQ